MDAGRAAVRVHGGAAQRGARLPPTPRLAELVRGRGRSGRQAWAGRWPPRQETGTPGALRRHPGFLSRAHGSSGTCGGAGLQAFSGGLAVSRWSPKAAVTSGARQCSPAHPNRNLGGDNVPRLPTPLPDLRGPRVPPELPTCPEGPRRAPLGRAFSNLADPSWRSLANVLTPPSDLPSLTGLPQSPSLAPLPVASRS